MISRGTLVAGERCDAQVPQFVTSRRWHLGPQRDERDGLLAEHVVRSPDDRGLEHVGVAVEDVLDLLGVDVLAAADDHVLHAVDEHQEAVVVEVADVAGAQPPVAQHLRPSRPAG